MKQVLQHAHTGEITVAEVPAPQLLPGCVLVRVAASLVSAGTERAFSDFAGKSLIQKARARPDLVRDVFSKIRRDGLSSTVQAVRTRLDQPVPLGYSGAGTVVAVGEGVREVRVGDRVACAGAGYAVHAEVICVPRLLVAKIPDASAVSLEDAAFTTVGAVALHGIRTADVKLGDVVAVIGLGLLGQLTVQLLKSAGCRVLGMDLLLQRAELASRLGADATSASASEFRDLCSYHSRGFGVDVVLITAETSSSDPVNLASEIARDRAVVVAVGTVGMELQRKRYYEKELDFRISRSYGPGRYDTIYEQKGRDYPIGYVRWTETRNMEAFLQLLADKRLDVRPLVSHRFPIDRAQGAYDLITGGSGDSFLGILISYRECINHDSRLELVRFATPRASAGHNQTVSIGMLGAGNFAQSTLLPTIQRLDGVECIGLCSATGARGRHVADKFGFRYCTTRAEDILSDPAVSTVVIATRHHLHARQIEGALRSRKHVFCEKPLCLAEEELEEIVRTYLEPRTFQRPLLMVGFNRRFAPMAVHLKSFLSRIGESLTLQCRVNAGCVPGDHWVNDPEQGGGRILGEVCHFVDFLAYLCGSAVIEVEARGLANSGRYSNDNLLIWLQFANGSQGTITYVANGDRAYSKERIEVFGGGAVAVLQDFRHLELVRDGRKQSIRSRWRQDKGHRGEWQAFAASIRQGCEAPISFQEIVNTTLATLCITDSLATGQPLTVDTAAFIDSVRSSRGT